MPALLQALLTSRHLAHQTVHRQQQLRMINAHRVPYQRRPARLHQRMLRQRAPRRMAQLPARLTIPDLALFAHHSRHLGVRLAHLTPQRLSLTEPIHDRLHRPIGGQIPGAQLVEEHQLAALRTRQRIDGRRTGGGRKQEALQVRCARIGARSRGGRRVRCATDDARIGLAEDADLVGLVLVGGDALGGTAAAGAAGAAVPGLRGCRRRCGVMMVMMVVVVLIVVLIVVRVA